MTAIVIAEIGSSPTPNWEFETWCAAAKAAGATHIKAQMFKAEHFPDAERDSKRPLEFPRERFGEFVFLAHRFGLQAGASVFDSHAAEIVTQRGDFIKLAAREQDNRMLIEDCFYHANRPLVIRSVSRYQSDEFVFLHSTITLFAIQQYPASLAASLWAVWRWARFAKRQGFAWGWSSHTTGDLDCRLAARLGAYAIEKHLCRKPDDLEAGHALNIMRFEDMARAINAPGKGER